MPPTTRIVMLGTGDFAPPTFEHLCDEGAEVIALVTQPDRPQGRKQELIPSPIKRAAIAGIPRRAARERERPRGADRIRAMTPDLLVTAAYGQILSPELLSLPPLGGINLHGSILPAYRGDAPCRACDREWGARDGRHCDPHDAQDRSGGDDRFRPDADRPRRDGGRARRPPRPAGCPARHPGDRRPRRRPSASLPRRSRRSRKPRSSARRTGRSTGRRPASRSIYRIRAMQPWPTASTFWRRRDSSAESPPVRLIVHKSSPVEGEGRAGEVLEAYADRLIVAAAAGAVRLHTVQVPGKKPAAVAEFLRGYHVLPGDRMGR